MIENRNDDPSLKLLQISFNLKQCTVYHNKFGCYSFEVKYGNQSKRSPTINILKEKVNLDVIISFSDIQFEGEEIIISLYNQMLVKNKQNDVLISQQILNLNKYTANSITSTSNQDSFLTFEKDGQLKASVKYKLQVIDPRESIEPQQRQFMNLLQKWMADTFLIQIIKQIESQEKRLADEEKLKQLKQQQEELLKKKKADEEMKKKAKLDEENEKRKIEKQKKLEELARLKQLQQEREQREKEKQQKEQEENEKLRLLKLKQKELKLQQQKKKEQEEKENDQRKQEMLKKQQQEEDELKQYEQENFEDYAENQKKKQNKSKKVANDDEIQEELVEETERLQGNYPKVNVSSNFMRQTNKSRQTSLIQIENYMSSMRGQSRDSSKDRSFLDRSGLKSRSNQKNPKKSFIVLLKQWMSKFLRNIIRQTSFIDKLNNYTQRFYIFGDETFPYILIFDPYTQQLDRITIPKSFTSYRYSQAVGLPNGKIFLCGGVNSKLNNILPFTQLYDPYLNKGYPLPNMHSARYTHSAIYFHDYVYVVGGRSYGNGEQSILNTFERFSLKTNKWEKLASLQDGRCTTCLIGLQDKKWLYLVGGFSPKGRLSQIERYSIEENSWKLLNIKLPMSIEAGITFNIQGSADSFYYMFGRGDDDRNEQIFQITVNPQSPQLDSVNIVGKVQKGRVLPCSFVDFSQNLYILGGDENAWEKFELSSFTSKYGKKSNIDLLPEDMKVFCSAVSQIENPRKPAFTGIKDAIYIHITVVDFDLSVKQFKTGKEQNSNTSNKISLLRQIKNYSCQLINSNYLLLFGGEYTDYLQKNSQTNIKPSSSQQIKSQKQTNQQKQNQVDIDKQNTQLSKECYIFSLNTGLVFQVSPQLIGKKNQSTFLINQMVYSFGGEYTVEGKLEVCNDVQRFHIKQNKWERMCSMNNPISLCQIFQYEKSLYLLGGVNSDRTFNNAIIQYDLQYDYFISSNKTIPFQYKHFIQFFLPSKQPSPYILLFSASFKKQGIVNLSTGDFIETEIVSVGSYLDEEKQVLRVSQEKDAVTFILPNKIDIYRVIYSNNNSRDQKSIPNFEVTKIKEIILQGGRSSSSVQKDQVVPIRNIFLTRYIDKRMEFFDFLEFNENRRVLRISSSIDGKNINSSNNLESISNQNGGVNQLYSIPSSNHIICLYKDNDDQTKLIQQELNTGFEEQIPLIQNNKDNSAKIFYKSVLSFSKENEKIYLTGGIEDKAATSHIIEIDIKKRQIQLVQEIITPRYNHCQIIVNNFLYMIGGCNITQSSKFSQNNSPSLQKNNQNSKSTNSTVILDKQPQLEKNSHSYQETKKVQSLVSLNSKIQSQILIQNISSMNTSISTKGKKQNRSASKNIFSIDNIVNDDENTESLNQSYSTNQISQIPRQNQFQSGQSRTVITSTTGTVLKKVDRLNLKNNQIEQIADLPHPVMNATCCQIRGEIFVIGGKDSLNTSVDIIQKYEIASNLWQIVSFKLWEPLYKASCLATGFNQIIVFGGLNSVGHGVKDIQVLDIKIGSTKKISSSQITNQPPLLHSHTTSQILSGKEIYLFDKNHIQCVEVMSNFDSFLVKEVPQITTIASLKDSKQIFGVFSYDLNDNQAITQQQLQNQNGYDIITIFGNEKNPIQIQYDMRTLKYKVTEHTNQNTRIKSSYKENDESNNSIQYLISNQSACFSEQDNSIILSGGIEYDNISSKIYTLKNYKFQSAGVELFIPRFLHASVCLQNKVYFIGGKSYQNKIYKEGESNISTATSNFQNNISQNSSKINEEKQNKYACSSECEVYDLIKQEVTKISQLNFPRSNIQAIALNDCVYVFGGFGGDKRLRTIEKFIPSLQKWEVVDCYLNSDLENYQLTKLSSSEAFIVGGKENGQNSSKIYIFNAYFNTLTLANIKLSYDFSALKCSIYNDELFVFGNSNKEAVVVSYNLRNAFQDTKIPIVLQLSLLDITWSSTLTKSF